MKKQFLVLFFVIAIGRLSFSQPKYEFRAVWVASVDNIDWPSRGNYNTDSQKVEFIKLLDMHQRNGMNAVIVQVRPATDAFYPSQYEPWSQWLTGKQGRPPSPYYDPLQFMIDETHKRGMEFHAWCNPYRAIYSIRESSVSPSHITKTHPGWFLSYGGTAYFDPGNKEVQQYVTAVIRDIVHRYDIDALHFDDYFYPYRIAGKEFPDDSSYHKYGNGMDKGDWRRSNVDSIIVSLGKAIKEENKYCKFGISPFGIWRNKDKDSVGSDTKAGQTNYDDLYADIVLWLKNGWIDYVAPQLYFEFGYRAAPYEVLLDWWSKHTYGKHCYIGLGVFKAGMNAIWRDRTLIPRELVALRNYPQVQGAIYFSSKSFEKNPNGWSDSLRNNYYKYPALIPAMEWIDSARPQAPQLFFPTNVQGWEGHQYAFSTAITNNETNLRQIAVYIFKENGPVDKNDPGSLLKLVSFDRTAPNQSFKLFDHEMNKGAKIKIAITAISKNNVESELSNLIPMSYREGYGWEIQTNQ